MSAPGPVPSGSPTSGTPQRRQLSQDEQDQLIGNCQRLARENEELKRQRTGDHSSPISSQDAAKIGPPRPDSKPARVSLNGKEYQIIIKRPGSDNNKLSPAVAQKFATLFGTTLKYGLAALCHQHNLKEKDIKLKYVKIKKKLDGDLFLTYKDKSNKYKIEITKDLRIDRSDKDEISKKLPGEKRENVNTAYKTFEKAIEIFEEPAASADAANSSIIGIYDLNIDANCLSKKVKEFYDPKNKIDPKPLGSKSNKAQEKPSSDITNKGEVEIDGKRGNIAVEEDQKIENDSEIEEDREEEVESGRESPAGIQEEEQAVEEEGSKNSSSKPNSSAASTSPSEPAKANETTKLNEVDKPLVVSEEEKDISTIPFRSTDARTDSTWKNYLFNGTLGGEGKLPSHRTLTPRDVNTASFNIDEAEKIVTKIIVNPAIDNFEDKEKVFLKRFLLQLLADNNSKKKVGEDPLKNCLKQRLDWTIATFGLVISKKALQLLDLEENKVKMCSALNETLQKIQKQTAS